MFKLQKVKKSTKLVIVIVMINYLGFVTFSNNNQKYHTELKENKSTFLTLNEKYNSEIKRNESATNRSASSVSWLDHLCPRYHRREEPPLKLTWESPVEGNIFFTQTSCQTHLNAREACAIESASFHHPHRTIQVFMTAPAINHTHPLMEVLMTMSKVKFSWMNLDQFFRDSPIKEWHQQRLWLYNEMHAPAFVSDAARVALLWHFGGTYIDLDAITLRPFPNVANFVGRLYETQINLAVSNFTKGHPLIEMIWNRLPEEFVDSKSASIGPALLTNCLLEYCPGNLTFYETKDFSSPELCKDITVFPMKMFYPVSFMMEPAVEIFETGKGFGPRFFDITESYSLHLFSSLTPLLKTNLGGDSILEEAAKRNCPNVYASVLRHKLDL